MVKQTRIDRRNALRRLWKDIGKTFLILYSVGLVIVIAMPMTRHAPLAYFVAFLLSFGIAFIWLFIRVKEKPPEFAQGDR